MFTRGTALTLHSMALHEAKTSRPNIFAQTGSSRAPRRRDSVTYPTLFTGFRQTATTTIPEDLTPKKKLAPAGAAAPAAATRSSASEFIFGVGPIAVKRQVVARCERTSLPVLLTRPVETQMEQSCAPTAGVGKHPASPLMVIFPAGRKWGTAGGLQPSRWRKPDLPSLMMTQIGVRRFQNRPPTASRTISRCPR